MQLKWHECDTESAQIVLDRANHDVVGATSGIHYYGESLPAGRVELYIAQRSHAVYLRPSGKRGHQAMMGNLGFGGKLVVSLKTVWDRSTPDREVDYRLRIPPEDAPLFHWKGRWGAREKYHPADAGARNREPGPRSFAYRNALPVSGFRSFVPNVVGNEKWCREAPFTPSTPIRPVQWPA
ncbi:MAG: hypothetical protein MAG794_00561 [Gammaproteobacteria bacterium]|nr:hypothetical protein [Gammaproteobacteria bacterium]